MSVTRRKMRLLHCAVPRACLYPVESTRFQETRIVRVRTSQQCIAVFHRRLPFPSPESISLYGYLHYTELETDKNAFANDSTFSATTSSPDGRWICAAGICNVFENKTLQRNRYMPYVIKGVGVFDRLPSLLSFMLLIANDRESVVNCRGSDDSNAATSSVDEIGAQCLIIDQPSPHSIQLCDAIAPVLPQVLAATSDATQQNSTPGALETCSNRSMDDMSSKRASLSSPVLSSHMSGPPVRKRGRPPRSQTSRSDKENAALQLGTPLGTSSYAAKTLKAPPTDSNSSKFLVSERSRPSSSRIHRPSLRKLLSVSSDHSRVPLIKRIRHVQLFAPDLHHRIVNTSTQLVAPNSDDHHIDIENVNNDNGGDTTEEDTPTPPRSRDSGSVYHPDTSPVCSPLRIGGKRRKTNNSASASMGLEFAGTSRKRKNNVKGRVSVEVRMESLSLPKKSIVVGNLDELEEEDSFKIE